MNYATRRWKMNSRRALLAAALLCGSATVSAAPLTGQTLSASAGLSPAAAVVGPGVEFTVSGLVRVDFDEDGLMVLAAISRVVFGGGLSPYVFGDLNGTIADIVGFDIVSLGAGTGNLSHSDLAFATDSFSLSLAGVVLESGELNTFRVTFAGADAGVPEPASLALLGLGLAGLGWIRRRT